MSIPSLSRERLSAVKAYDEFFSVCQILAKEEERALFEFLFRTAITVAGDGSNCIAGLALIELEPRCTLSCADAIDEISNSRWDVSRREIPFYLVSQFGKWTVAEAVNAFLARSDKSVEQKKYVEAVWYWASGPSAKLAEDLFYWEWQEVIEESGAQRIRLDRASEASHDLSRLLDEPVVRVDRDAHRK